jgi:hypothetical protein
MPCTMTSKPSFDHMQVASNHQSCRGVQRSPRPGTASYMQGKSKLFVSEFSAHLSYSMRCYVKSISCGSVVIKRKQPLVDELTRLGQTTAKYCDLLGLTHFLSQDTMLVLREYRNFPYEAVLYGWEKIRVNSGNQQTEFLQARAIWPPERK